jgi:hypothetical protein
VTVAQNKARTLNTEQAAEMLGVSRRWLVREGIRKAKIPYLRPPGSNLLIFLESDLWKVLESWRMTDRVGTPPREKREHSANGQFKSKARVKKGSR